ncbi:hypothetical protein ACFYOK_11940 [Microbispora bryophytorum]
MGELGDIVDAVLFLEHVPVVAGEIPHVDGGMSAGHRASDEHRHGH